MLPTIKRRYMSNLEQADRRLWRKPQSVTVQDIRGSMPYHHTQTGKVILVVLGIAIVLMMITYLTIEPARPIVAPTIGLLLVLRFLFASLTVEINNANVVCYFGPGLIRRKIALTDIRKVEAVRNPWIVGWGIRWMPGQYWLWNVSGYDAVELTLTNGSKFRIGTDEPEALVRAIQVNKAAVM